MGSGIIKCAVDDQLNEVKVRKVLYVPTFGSNLLSVKKLTKDGGFELSFKDDICKIIKEGKVLAYARLGKEMQDLYAIDVVVERACAAVSSHHKDNCQHVCHRRFGHRDPNAIKILAEKGLATGITLSNCGRREICECYVQSKLARKPFPQKNGIKTQATLDLVQTDICGPMQTTTPGKKRYTITIDDFSRFTTIHFMETKDEVAKFIKQFVEMTNGVAERKNRSLIEMARCMLLDVNMEKKYWVEAVNTANCLHNRLHIRTTGRSPYELW